MKNNAAPPRDQSGFSLVEAMVAMVMIGILLAIAIAGWRSLDHRAKQRSTMADMRTISVAIASYSVDTGMVPDDSQGLAPLAEFISSATNSRLPIHDRWGNTYRYVVDQSGNYSLESFGKDGINGANYTKNNPSGYEQDLVLFNGIFVAAPE